MLKFFGVSTAVFFVGLSYFFFRLLKVSIHLSEKNINEISLLKVIDFSFYPLVAIAGPINNYFQFSERKYGKLI